ncbi:MAG: nucleotide-binding protein [Acidobacteriales bacterium]|nr:nucleotide-binding protein [Terriglobales bacterium]
MVKSLTVSMLNSFIAAAGRHQSRSDMLKHFLRMVIFRGGMAHSGSILVWEKAEEPEGALRLFNDGDFLFKEGFLDRDKYPKSKFAPWEGLAGEAFTSGRARYNNDVTSDPNYINRGEPIKSMVCVPIILPSRSRPFGVASFHNPESEPGFDEEARDTIELAVSILSLALALGGAWQKQIFLVHGRDTEALTKLQLILERRAVRSISLSDEPGTGELLLQKLEEIVAECSAGFVLLTPDDEGRLRSSDSWKLRARQNVVFEGGLLSAMFRDRSRVCFLKTGEIELPSDLHGVKYEQFDPKQPNEGRIERILTEWGVTWARPNR